MEPMTSKTLRHLREIFNDSNLLELSTVEFHDLACYILHRLLIQAQKIDQEDSFQASSVSVCMRNAVVLYMLIIHGLTYFSHASLQHNCVQHLSAQLGNLLPPLLRGHASVALWLLSVCMVASNDKQEYQWFSQYASEAMGMLRICTWEAILTSLRTVLWFNQSQTETLFRKCWTAVLKNDETLS